MTCGWFHHSLSTACKKNWSRFLRSKEVKGSNFDNFIKKMFEVKGYRNFKIWHFNLLWARESWIATCENFKRIMGNSVSSITAKIVFCYQKFSDILCEKLFLLSRKTNEIRSWRPRICKKFEITRTICSNSEKSEQFLVTDFFNLYLEVSEIQ